MADILGNILIISDDSELARLVREVAAAKGVRAIVIADVPSALQQIQKLDCDMVLLGPGPCGGELESLASLKASHPELPVAVVSRESSPQHVVKAMREGCHDYLVPPVARKTIESLLEALVPRNEVPLAAPCEDDSRWLYRIAGKSPALLETVRLAIRVAPTSVPVLITGESGAGKELISHLLHRHSSRAGAPYIRVNCAALSESLLESELFGHERGAFTGAYAQRKGHFERAHRGTLLLDEVSETGPRLQAELLRVLEQQDFHRVGGGDPVQVNVRMIATSNRDLARDVEAGRFRADLYYRISGVHLAVPALRDRKEDIPALVWHFINQYSAEAKRQIARIEPATLEEFRRYHWPGNVRELRNVVRTALILGDGPALSLKGLRGTGFLIGAPHAGQAALPDTQAPKPALPGLLLQDLERHAVLEALRRTKRNQTKAAQLLGITDRTLREKIRRYRQSGFIPTAQEALASDQAEMDSLTESPIPQTAGEARW
jgi:DNA-binding NtrC family response regulator